MLTSMQRGFSPRQCLIGISGAYAPKSLLLCLKTLSVFKALFFYGGLKKKVECYLISNSSFNKSCPNFHADKIKSWVIKFSGIIQKQRTWPAVRGVSDSSHF